MFADLIDRQVEVPISETFLLLRIIGGGELRGLGKIHTKFHLFSIIKGIFVAL